MGEFLSIGIPARNEQESIERTIRSITKSTIWRKTPSNEKELIICVNGSTDATATKTRILLGEFPEIKIIRFGNIGKSQAINEIAKATSKKASIIYFSDADVLVKRDTIEKVVGALKAERKVEFASPIVIPSAAFFPRRKRGPTSELYVEASRVGRELKLYRLCGPGFAVRKKFIIENPLPKEPIVSDDLFINLSHPEKIKVVYDAVVVWRQPSLADHFRQRVRLRMLKKSLLGAHPELTGRNAAERKKTSPRKLDWIRKVSPKAQLGFILNQAAELAASISAKKKHKEVWPTIKSTKLSRRR